MADQDGNPPSETPEIHDPMSLRDTDTSRLKRIKPQTSLRVANTDGSTEVGSETVHLKVIKEKKKQLAGILSASQTIRLRPAGGEAAPAAGPAPAAEAPRPGALRLSAPSSIDPSTSKVQRAQRSPDEMIAGDERRPTLKMRAPGAESGGAPPAGPTLKLQSPAPVTQEAPAAGQDSGQGGRATLKLKAPGEQKLKTHSLPRLERPAAPAPQSELETSAVSKSTLKLRAPGAPAAPAAPAAPTQQAPSPGGTLKLRAPGSGDVTSEAQPAGAPATLKLRAPVAATADNANDNKATLKLRAPTSPAAPPAGDSGGAPATLKLRAPSSAQTVESKASPAQTVRQEAPRPEKTLKLRSTPSTGSGAGNEAELEGDSQESASPQPAARPAARYAAPTATPGALYTLGAVASLGLVGFVCYLTVTQYLEMWLVK